MTEGNRPAAIARTAIVATPAQLAATFTEWMRRYQENPDQFSEEQDMLTVAPATYGEACTPYFLQILDEVRQAPSTPKPSKVLAFLAKLFGRNSATNHVPPARHTPPPITAECDRIVNLLLHLCDGDKQTANWLTCWLAYPLQNPGAKLNTAIVMHGDAGAGKSLFFEHVMLQLYGEHAHVTQPEYLDRVFNAWASGKRFVLVENFSLVGTSRQFYVRLKCLIANSATMIEEKAKPIRVERNLMNFVFLSNTLPDLPAIGSDRRFFIIRTGERQNSAFYALASAQILNGGVEAFRRYLLNDVDCSAWVDLAMPIQSRAGQAEVTA